MGVDGVQMNINEEVTLDGNGTRTETITEEAESTIERPDLSEGDKLLLQELENARNKLIQGAYTRYDKKAFSDFFGEKGSTPKRVNKRKERYDSEIEKLASEFRPKKKKRHTKPKGNVEFMTELDSEFTFTMKLPKQKKKNTKPKRGKAFMQEKSANDLKTLVEFY